MKVLFVGDVHGQHGWWKVVLREVKRLKPDLIIPVGDFAWKWHLPFMKVVLDGIQETGTPVWPIEGNHDDYDLLKGWGIFEPEELVPQPMFGGDNGLFYLPRGTVQTIGDVVFQFMGGGVSIDKVHRLEREAKGDTKQWWPEETISAKQLFRAKAEADAKGPIDVLVSHDSIDGYFIPGTHPGYKQQFADSEAHRFVLGNLARHTEPKLLIHGHYHSGYTAVHPYMDMVIRGLDRDDSSVAQNMFLFDDRAWNDVHSMLQESAR